MDCTKVLKLSEVPVGKKAKIIKVSSTGLSKQRLLDLGMVENTIIHVLRKSAWGDPTAFLIRNTCIALRCEESSNIEVILWD
ncbi:FeoA family protein [Hathewaya histolytica]|uniref:FeoA family protein n=1 Tax=Hathewaya histolytica TaxID=1498 RepID=A0A4U9QVI7_HATHI|nr:FeoA family protein [Hathewaya histolytica]VTQ82562.1 feoA family protein [Hathewaya histolytica]